MPKRIDPAALADSDQKLQTINCIIDVGVKDLRKRIAESDDEVALWNTEALAYAKLMGLTPGPPLFTAGVVIAALMRLAKLEPADEQTD